MNQVLDKTNWQSIRFEGVDLPQSLMGISILISIDDFTERTRDWIWSLAHCKGLEKSGDAKWVADSAGEVIDHLTENSAAIVKMILERLAPHGFSAARTFVEWLESLITIREIASEKEGECRWIAEIPGCDPKLGLDRAMRFLDPPGKNNP